MPENPEENKYKQTAAQLEKIEAEIRDTQSLTSEPLPTEALRSLYEKDSNFDKGVVYLAKHYRCVRRVRGDGNCYYRALLYSLCESLLIRQDERQRITARIQQSLDQLVTQYGYERFALEAFHEEFVELLQTMTQDTLHSTLNEENSTSDYATWYMRVLTSAYLKADPDRFLPYIENYPDIITFCAKEVEPMGKECTMVEVMALAETLDVNVVIEYLDGRDLLAGDKLTQHTFGPAESKTKVTLLYRPGHYDVLYK